MTNLVSRWTLDIVFGIYLTLLVSALVVFADAPTPVRAGVVLPFLTFVPGYGLIAALYPERRTDSDRKNEAQTSPSASVASGGIISTAERAALTPIASAALVGSVVLVLEFTPFGLEPLPILGSIAVATCTCFLVAFGRRAQLPPEQRGGVAVAPAFDHLKSQFVVTASSPFGFESDGATNHRHVVLNLLVVVALVAVVVSAGTLVVSETAGQEFTEFYLVGENETGAYTVNSVPQNFTVGESRSVVVTLTNQEGEPHNYTVISKYQRVNRTPNEAQVVSERRLGTFEEDVAPGETARIRHRLEPNQPATNARVVYLLYTGDPPTNPTRANADQSLRLWISVRGN
ncbi:hypothetical protein C440_03218 [Haloferax mucosum ATCC BAA-1512]|uniref:DUF1616 domain-containing protein n=1 Tax=Haloferax mucosum ATCC BAA-1512 TaxID=662479 RepID=M0IIX9_9EURY|nr:DUF1616 domain-containing protein [Haloferax mucosum]ELZ96751.1 hypothetical protein C440_03218 [Haloferax mucosum ATCC BAA-1512]